MQDAKVIGTTIPANEALSGVVDIGNHTFVAIEMPEAWAGTTITFQSKANTKDEVHPVEDWDNVYDDEGNEVSVIVAANRVVTLRKYGVALAGLRYLRVRSGTAAAPVNQNPEKVIRFIVK